MGLINTVSGSRVASKVKTFGELVRLLSLRRLLLMCAPAVLRLPVLWWLLISISFKTGWYLYNQVVKRSMVSEVWPARACVKAEFPELFYSLAQLSKDVSGCLRKKVQPWPWRTAGLGGGRVGAGVIEGIWTVRLGHLEAPSILSFFCPTVPEVFIWENKAMAPKRQRSLFTYYPSSLFPSVKMK